MTTTKARRLTTKQRVEKFMADNGIDFEVSRWSGPNGQAMDLSAWAPPGKMFYVTQAHSCVANRWTAAEAWTAMWKDCQLGLVDCDNEGCEGCEAE
jgi:hypothetical protein